MLAKLGEVVSRGNNASTFIGSTGIIQLVNATTPGDDAASVVLSMMQENGDMYKSQGSNQLNVTYGCYITCVLTFPHVAESRYHQRVISRNAKRQRSHITRAVVGLVQVELSSGVRDILLRLASWNLYRPVSGLSG